MPASINLVHTLTLTRLFSNFLVVTFVGGSWIDQPIKVSNFLSFTNMTNSTTHPPPVHLTESPTTHSIQTKIGPESSSDSSSSDIKLEQNGSTSGLGSVRPGESNGSDSKKKRVGPKRKKVTHGKLPLIHFTTARPLLHSNVTLSFLARRLACVYCRRSHMTCDDGTCFYL